MQPGDESTMDFWACKDVAFAVVVSGPSGVGKTSLVRILLELDPRCVRSVSATTRPRRLDERDGESYFFMGEEQFLRMRAQGELVESARYHGAWYGTPKSFLKANTQAGRSVVLNIEVQGGLQLREQDPEAVLIFVLPPSWDELRRRLLGRGTETPEAVEERIRRGHEECGLIERYDYVVVNDVLGRCAADLAAIVRAERCRRQRFRGQERSGA